MQPRHIGGRRLRRRAASPSERAGRSAVRGRPARSVVVRGRRPVGQVGLDRRSELGRGHRLQPDVHQGRGSRPATASHRTACLRTADGGEGQRHLGLEERQVAGVDEHQLAGLQVVLDDLARELHPRRSVAQRLLKETPAPPNPRRRASSAARPDLHVRRAGHVRPGLHHELVGRVDAQLPDHPAVRRRTPRTRPSGAAYSVRNSCPPPRARLRPLMNPPRPPEPNRGGGLHLEARGQPGDVLALGDDPLAGVQGDLQDGHGGARRRRVRMGRTLANSAPSAPCRTIRNPLRVRRFRPLS